MRTTIQEILEIKATMLEIAKDTPLVMYFAFYEPLHTWMSQVADGWNPFVKFILNVVMVVYGVLRIVALVKSWNKPPHDSDGIE